MFKQLRKWHRSLFPQTSQPNAASPACAFEPLENRQLLSAAVSGIFADNRGMVTLNITQDLKATTVNTKTVQILTAGNDGKLGTSDDVRKKTTVHYSSSADTITAKSTLAANTRYRVRLIASKIKGVDGKALDGEFKGATHRSGNGAPGGNYDITTKVSGTPVARFMTTDGNMDVTLFKSQVATTVNNFTTYANEGAWDRSFFHRSVANFVIQGGGFQVTSDNGIAAVGTHAQIPLQAGLDNARGTIAMARTNVPDSATNQFFFNTKDNPGLNPGGFTVEGYAVFGKINNAAGLATMDRIAARETVNANTDPKFPGFNGQFGILGEVPVRNKAAFDARSTPTVANLDPNADVIKITRIAMKMGVAKTA
ncbi:MAG TPA: peptidylprolyl isomerase [Tepidisphaeraceae bacterium]|jgi:peptidyl-prolyl cis-trans isomerase A (cyclophilin A)|nr:peptidylprolyl isomerase [Tepidisphaeraceae bacterium]